MDSAASQRVKHAARLPPEIQFVTISRVDTTRRGRAAKSQSRKIATVVLTIACTEMRSPRFFTLSIFPPHPVMRGVRLQGCSFSPEHDATLFFAPLAFARTVRAGAAVERLPEEFWGYPVSVRIQCPHCATSYMVMSGVEKQANSCPRCRRNFLPGSVVPVPPAPPWTAPAPPSAANTAPAPPRQPALGYLMILASWILGPGTVFAVHAMSSDTDWLTTLLLMLLMVGGTLSAGWLLLRGRRLVAQHAADLLDSDTRPPLLLLRSFADNELEGFGSAA